MIGWRDRPAEVANLLNPAFVAVVIARAAAGYQDEAGRAMPFGLAFVAVPLVLHRGTRERLPRDARTRMTSWLLQMPEVRVGFADRARDVSPFVREALSFALAARGVRITPDGGIEVGTGVSVLRLVPADDPGALTDANDCLRRATFVGKWLARAGSPSTVFALWGIRP
jgi:hypothetical protein